MEAAQHPTGEGGDADLLMECADEEMDVFPKSAEKEDNEKREGGNSAASVNSMEGVMAIPIPVQPDSSNSQDNTLNSTVTSSDTHLGLKVNGRLVSLPGDGVAELKLFSHPGGSRSGFTSVKITQKDSKLSETQTITASPITAPSPPAPAVAGPGPTPIITGVVSGEAAQRVLSDHCANFKSGFPLMQKTPPAVSAPPSSSLQTTPSSSVSPITSDRPAEKKGEQGLVFPPSCQVCGAEYKFITQLRGFICMCSQEIAISLTILEKKRKRRSRGRRSRDRHRFSKSPRDPQTFKTAGASAYKVSPPSKVHRLSDDITSPTPLSTTSSPNKQGDPQDPSQGKLVILVEDFYYGSAPGRASRNTVTDGVNFVPFSCPLCQCKLSNNIEFMRHMKLHIQAFQQDRRRHSLSSCPRCFRHFMSPFRLQRHLETVHREDKTIAKCKICEVAFSGETAFLWHMKTTHKPGEMPYTCQVCGFRTSFYSSLWSHFEMAHADTKHLLCPFCLRVMSNSAFYQQHISRHQKKHVLGCSQCRLHFLYLKEVIQHKQLHHRTHVKPAQLTGLKPGTKVTVRTYSVIERSEAEASSKMVDADLPRSRQEVGKRKLVESLGGLLFTQSRESESEDVSQPAPRCVECLSPVENFEAHFPSLVRCSLCSYITCCCTSYANHMINNHAANRNAPQYTSIFQKQPRLSETLNCASCTFSTCRGDIMANHLMEEPEHQCTLPYNDQSPPEETPAVNQTSEELFAPLEEEFEPEEFSEAPEEMNINLQSSDREPDQQNQNVEEEEKPKMNLYPAVTGQGGETVPEMSGHQEALLSTSPTPQNANTFDVGFGADKFVLYHLIDERGQSHSICNPILLTPLVPIKQVRTHPTPSRMQRRKNLSYGLIKKIKSSSTPSVAPSTERKGAQDTSGIATLGQIQEHIESFHPTVSHYSRNNSQDERFLPSDVTVQVMYEDFTRNHICSFKRYQKAVDSYNVSFTRPGEELCPLCLQQENHMSIRHHGMQEPPPNCLTCEVWLKHKERATKATRHYKQDSKKMQDDQLSIRRVDLQRVILLPRIPGEYWALQSKRISAFHETFASVGRKKKSISVVWHEGVALRKAGEVASAYVCALQREEDVPHIVVWLDGCTIQNRNHFLVTTLVTLVNQYTNCIQDVTLKYFEPGHTFTPSACFHQGLEKEMKRQPGGQVLTFHDFKKVVATCHWGEVDMVELRNEDIRAWTEESSRRKVKKAPPLPDVAQIQFRRGSKFMWVKLSHDQEEFLPVDYLKNKTHLTIPEPLRPAEKGIGRKKKAEMLRNLRPILTPWSRSFFENLNENSDDEEDDEEEED